MDVFIGGAWPYANGSLHIGHVAGLLPGDILARYYRLKGERVLYVSGSDCNGTPITIRAMQEGMDVTDIADRYHQEFEECFTKLGFSYDCYTRTDSAHHASVVQDLFLKIDNNGLLYTKEIDQVYCNECDQFLPDRYVEGICPTCGEQARGDQCDYCSTILDPVELHHKTCKICGSSPVIKKTEHYYLALSKLQHQVEELKRDREGFWRENALQLTERYLREGLKDRPATRDLPNGVSVPIKGFEHKKIYVWIEAVAGYYSASLLWGKENGRDVEDFWRETTRSYYVHGKDNIPFHSIIWPAIQIGSGLEGLPDYIVSNDYVTLEKKKISTSKNWAIWIQDLLERYHPDSIRYFLTINAPENRDTDFSWREFIYSHNGELLGAYGNFVNRTLKFIQKQTNGVVPQLPPDKSIQSRVESLYQQVGEAIEAARMKQALEGIFECIRYANKYFDEQQPWKAEEEKRDAAIATCVFLIINFAQLLHPFLPHSSEEVRKMLHQSRFSWKVITNLPLSVENIHPLFERIDIRAITEEGEKLRSQIK
ncbi:methionine--tRNA ligase [Robertmurraya korlensis]|uniref:methionine--tRNA ligase n=1 Tax=Robertmurraya korlensis TaxID=519977 RepID=UPI000826DDC4|nr:methionine--tRNA ligase [Robertmurraya korlensis]